MAEDKGRSGLVPAAAAAAMAAAAAAKAAGTQKWVLKSGETVVDRHRSHLHAGVTRLLPEALKNIDAQGKLFLVASHDFGRVVGETVCVATKAGDAVVYAQRIGRHGLSRFVKNRAAEPTSSVTVILKKGDQVDGRDEYVLVTAFLGTPAEPEPWDRNLRDAAAKQRSRTFWGSHALVWGSEPVVDGTETAW